MIYQVLVTVFASIVCAAAMAADAESESLRGINDQGLNENVIGRVFMSPSERLALDQLRLVGPKPARNPDTSMPTPLLEQMEKETSDGIGYIIASGGTALEWHVGEFRKVADAEVIAVDRSASIRIVRHEKSNEDTGLPNSSREIKDENRDSSETETARE
jgi:hypothetical protein